jgi:hypothetical protein
MLIMGIDRNSENASQHTMGERKETFCKNTSTRGRRKKKGKETFCQHVTMQLPISSSFIRCADILKSE